MKLSLLTLFFISTISFSAEVDHFTGRFHEKQEDSLEKINKLMNDHLDIVIAYTNNKSPKKCNETFLYRNLRKYFNNKYRGKTAKEIWTGDQFDRRFVSTKNSIFGGLNMFDSIVQGGLRVISDPISSVLNVNGYEVGTDKFEHFFGTGFRYFRKHYLQGKTVNDALRHGYNLETGLLGSTTTAVTSYADLAANFNGMRFWNHLLLKGDDVLGKQFNLGPYVICEDNKFQKNISIDIAEYIDDSYDEAINCSRFRNETILKKVEAHVEFITRKAPEGSYTCPLDPGSIEALEVKYGKLSKYLLNPYGHSSLQNEKINKLLPSP